MTELLRSDWPEFAGFGQAIITKNEPNVIRGWHWHRRQTDAIVVVAGRAKVALYDGRPGSPTEGRVEEYGLNEEEPVLLVVPPGVYHGYKTLGEKPALILNFPDHTYRPEAPDEQRVPHDAPFIPYRW